MKALYERTQSRIQLSNGIGRTTFKLKVRVQLPEDQTHHVNRYNLRDAIIIDSHQPDLVRVSILVGFLCALFGFLLAFIFAMATFNYQLSRTIGPLMFACGSSALLGVLGSFGYYHFRRKTIYFRDLLAGRTFRCRSVVDLVEKEAWMERMLSYLRHVIEASKNWGDVEIKEIEALPPEEANKAILPKMKLFAVDLT